MDPQITPDTNLATLPRHSGDSTGSTRVYFYDLDTRQELTDHVLNGCCWTGSHGMAQYRGMYIDGSVQGVSVIVWTKAGPRRGYVDSTTFAGRRIAVKTWHGPEHTDWAFLTSGDGSKHTGNRPNDVPADITRVRKMNTFTDTVVDGKAYARMAKAA